MKAYELHPVRGVARMSLTPPPGIEIVTIDADTLMLATPLCQNTLEEAFIVGTAPTVFGVLSTLSLDMRRGFRCAQSSTKVRLTFDTPIRNIEDARQALAAIAKCKTSPLT